MKTKAPVIITIVESALLLLLGMLVTMFVSEPPQTIGGETMLTRLNRFRASFLQVAFACTIFTLLHVRSDANNYPDALIVLPGARNVKHFEYEGTDQLGYELNAKYPASNVIKDISESLAKKGWKPLEKDYLNLQSWSSHVKGWIKFEDASKEQVMMVHQWAAQWQDKDGNVVWYAFRYQYPVQGPIDISLLKISGIYVPVEIAKQMRSKSNQSEQP